MKRRRIAAPSADLLKLAKQAAPAPRLPKGFFDPLVEITRTLMDQGMKLHQATDWLIANKALLRKHRDCFHHAMRGRLSRLTQKKAKTLTNIRWKGSLAFDSLHAVADCGTSLCGAKSFGWILADLSSPSLKCSRCKGIVTRQNVTIPEVE
jgi:hypothetical protein